jgi:SAM-dependent methyltransferase
MLKDGQMRRLQLGKARLHEPAAVVRQLVRVTRPGGRLVVFDFDWDTLVVDHPHRALTRTLVRSVSDGIRHGWIGRQLLRLCQEAGVVAPLVEPHTVRFTVPFLHWLLDGHLGRAQAAGEFTRSALDRWWQRLHEAEQHGRFFAAMTGAIVTGSAP